MKGSKLKPLLVVVLSCIHVVTMANDMSRAGSKQIPTTIINDFVLDPWMYVVGAVIFLYAAVELLSSDRKNEAVRTREVKKST